MKNIEKKESRRSFGGKITDFKDKAERAYEDRHLKAYLRGEKFFVMGRDPKTKEPKYHPVIENWS